MPKPKAKAKALAPTFSYPEGGRSDSSKRRLIETATGEDFQYHEDFALIGEEAAIQWHALCFEEMHPCSTIRFLCNHVAPFWQVPALPSLDTEGSQPWPNLAHELYTHAKHSWKDAKRLSTQLALPPEVPGAPLSSILWQVQGQGCFMALYVDSTRHGECGHGCREAINPPTRVGV